MLFSYSCDIFYNVTEIVWIRYEFIFFVRCVSFSRSVKYWSFSYVKYIGKVKAVTGPTPTKIAKEVIFYI